MLKAYKYRIYPNEVQKEQLAKHFGCVRYIYNWGLGLKKDVYEKEQKRLSRKELQNKLVHELKKECDWLGEVNSQSLLQSLLNLDNAYQRFFREQKGFPKFKSKHDHRQIFQCPQHTKVDFTTRTLSIVKIPDIKARYHRKFTGKIKTVTISKTASGAYYASILVATDHIKLPCNPIKTETSLGLDMGIKDFIVGSDGSSYPNLRVLKENLSKLKLLQRKQRKKVKGSKNSAKYRIKVARLHEKIKNRRLNYIHQITSALVNESQVDTICIEDLHVKGMLRNKYLSQSISDIGIGHFYDVLRYKCEWYGVNLKKIGRFAPSSKTCHKCGWRNASLRLSEREWTCEGCKTKHDRDLNAAINIRNIGVEHTEYKSVEYPLVDERQATDLRSNDTMKQKKRGGKTPKATKSLA